MKKNQKSLPKYLEKADKGAKKLYDRTIVGLGRFQRWILRHRVTSAIYRYVYTIFEDNVIGIAAQTAFFLLLSIFPIVLVIASWLARFPLDVDAGILETLLPAPVLDIVINVVENSPTSPTSTILPIIVSVWSASAGIWALMRGIGVAHTGSIPQFVSGRLRSIFLMIGFIFSIAVSLALWIFGREIIAWLEGTFNIGTSLLSVGRHIFTFLILYFFVFALYVLTPGYVSKRRYMLIGAAFAATGWAIVTFVFENYITKFSNYSVLYGSVGAFLGLAVWLMAISMVILLGAELNSMVIDHKLRKERTKPKGRRIK